MRTTLAFLWLIAVILTVFAPIFAYSGGSGTAVDPYQISTVADWQQLMNSSGDWDKSFILTADQDLAGVSLTPIGSNTNFSGVFDGNSYTIRNAAMNFPSNDYIGLFSIVSSPGRVKNLRVEHTQITGKNYVGGLCGWNYRGTISNCFASGTISGGKYASHLGGLCGSNDYGTIKDCHSTSTVTGGDNSSLLGLLCGDNSYGSIRDCHANGTVSGEYGSNSLGGLCGRNFFAGTISDCYATGTVNGGHGSQYVGGLCGQNTYGTITNCCAKSTVFGGDVSYYLGGLCGMNSENSAQIINCFAMGSVIAGDESQHIGGLCGSYLSGTISGCFWDTLTSGQTTSEGGIGKTTTQMKTLSTFTDADWDFATVWMMCEDKDYPRLQWEGIQCPKYSGGLGTEEDPFQIATPADLIDLGNTPDDYDKHFILMADIDLAGKTYDSGAVISMDTNPTNGTYDGSAFTGSFDGNGYKIMNLTIPTGKSPRGIGLFGKIGAGSHIVNLKLENVTIDKPNSWLVGGLCGWNENGIINNCCVTGSVSGASKAGGLCGINQGTISNSYATGNIGGGGQMVGGLCGDNQGTLSNCYATGSVTSTSDGSSNVGGLVGYNNGWTGTISGCYATGNVTTTGIETLGVGGLCGGNGTGGIITGCYASGSVDSGKSVGGLCGINQGPGTISSSHATGNISGVGMVGGLCGQNQNGTITNCYATGNTIETEDFRSIGGLCGTNYGGEISNCFAIGSVTAISSNGGYTGGLCGLNTDGGKINGCYASGNVNSRCNGGGLCGINQESTITNCYASGKISCGESHGDLCGANQSGGLCGINRGTISNCYSTGEVVGGDTSVGGLCGINGGAVSYSFWDIQRSGLSYSEGGTGMTTAEMKTLSTYMDAGWDFVGETVNGTEDIWRMPTGGYPILSWQRAAVITPNGGESYIGGTTQDITWNADGVVGQLLLQYSVDNGSAWIDIVTVSNTGTYPWSIPNTLSGICLVKISSVDDPSIFDISDTVFSIVKPGVYFADANLKAAVEAALGVVNPTAEDMLKLTGLDAKRRGVVSLVGLETALNLYALFLDTNQVSDITPLAGLMKLATLSLYSNKVTDISPLAGLTKLSSLVLSANTISDITPLAGLGNLMYLYINNNPISDFSALTALAKFKEIYAARTAVLTRETYLTHIPAIRANNPKLTVFQYDPGCQTLRKADANADCQVNLLDLAVIASEWLTCNHIYEEMCP